MCLFWSQTFGESLTSMEQPIKEPRSKAFFRMWNKCGSGRARSCISAIPPVKSSKPSVVDPPERASYEPFTLEQRSGLWCLRTKAQRTDTETQMRTIKCPWGTPWPLWTREELTWRRPSPAEHSRTPTPPLSGRTTARRPWPEDGRPPPRPPTLQTARTTDREGGRGVNWYCELLHLSVLQYCPVDVPGNERSQRTLHLWSFVHVEQPEPELLHLGSERQWRLAASSHL